MPAVQAGMNHIVHHAQRSSRRNPNHSTAAISQPIITRLQPLARVMKSNIR
jgi:hypothetical protein